MAAPVDVARPDEDTEARVRDGFTRYVSALPVNHAERLPVSPLLPHRRRGRLQPPWRSPPLPRTPTARSGWPSRSVSPAESEEPRRYGLTAPLSRHVARRPNRHSCCTGVADSEVVPVEVGDDAGRTPVRGGLVLRREGARRHDGTASQEPGGLRHTVFLGTLVSRTYRSVAPYTYAIARPDGPRATAVRS